MKQIRDTICLLSSMVRGGENHSEISNQAVCDALNNLDVLQKELAEVRKVIQERGDCVTKVLKCGDILSRNQRR